MADNSDGGEKQTPSLTTKPYLMRAIYAWALDNGFTPQVLIATDKADVVVPQQYVKDNQIVLNIHPQSVSGLEIGSELLWCSTRFSGKAMEITAPVSAVLAIYARENGQGIVFQNDDNDITPPTNTPPELVKSIPEKKSQPVEAKNPATKQAPVHLKIVK